MVAGQYTGICICTFYITNVGHVHVYTHANVHMYMYMYIYFYIVSGHADLTP